MDTTTIAKKLIGYNLVHESPQGKTAVRIIETEAYLENDPASHAFRGESLRNAAMFKNPGTVYIYLIYGMYYCLNLVTGKKGVAEAVLIRAGEPLDGIDLMKKRTGKNDIYNLTNGPGKLCRPWEFIKP